MMMRLLALLVTINLRVLGAEESGDESDALVITVGELMQMVSSEDQITGKTENNTRGGKQISDEEIKVDFNSVVGENQMFCAKSYNGESFKDASEEKRCVEKVVLQKETEYDREVQCHHRSVGLNRNR